MCVERRDAERKHAASTFPTNLTCKTTSIGAGLLSMIRFDFVTLLHHLQLTIEVDAIIMLSLSRTLSLFRSDDNSS